MSAAVAQDITIPLLWSVCAHVLTLVLTGILTVVFASCSSRFLVTSKYAHWVFSHSYSKPVFIFAGELICTCFTTFNSSNNESNLDVWFDAQWHVSVTLWKQMALKMSPAYHCFGALARDGLKLFRPLLSHHPAREMKPGIIYSTREPHFPWSNVYSGFPVHGSDIPLCEKK